MISELQIVDPEMAATVRSEWERQLFTLDLLAPTNVPSRAIMEVQGSIFHSRSLEGYPGRRYHGGTRYLDIIESLAISRAKKLYGAEHANVQPNSGVCANMAVYFATVKPGDPIESLSLAEGGHLSHGHPASFSGKLFKPHFYGLDPETELIDYDQVEAIARRERPKLIITGGSAYPRVIDFARLRAIADEVGALLWADVAHYAGLIAGGVYPSPVPFCDFVTFTTYKTLPGCRGGVILCKEEYAKKIDSAVFPGVQGSPHMHLIAGKAVAFRIAMTQAYRDYSRQVVANARALAQALTKRGYRVVSGGTDTHLVLLDLRPQNITGKQAQEVLESANIVSNKNTIPNDPRSADVTSGLRLGTGIVTARGCLEGDMDEAAELVDMVLSNPKDAKTLERVRERVMEFCVRFPLYLDRREVASYSVED